MPSTLVGGDEVMKRATRSLATLCLCLGVAGLTRAGTIAPASAHADVLNPVGHRTDPGADDYPADHGRQVRGLALGLTGKASETAACGSVFGPVALAGALGVLADHPTEPGGGPPAHAHPGLTPAATVGSALPPPSAYNGLLAGARGTPSSSGFGGGGAPSQGGSGGNHPEGVVSPAGGTDGPGNSVSSNPSKLDLGFGPVGVAGSPEIHEDLGPDWGDLHHPGLPSSPPLTGGSDPGPGHSTSPPYQRPPDLQPPGIQSTPEPSSLVLAGIAAFGLLGYTWRRWPAW
jgi:hypothetical protein